MQFNCSTFSFKSIKKVYKGGLLFLCHLLCVNEILQLEKIYMQIGRG
jgi:hypothetical protein